MDKGATAKGWENNCVTLSFMCKVVAKATVWILGPVPW